MKKKSIGLIIGLMGFALLGVMAMQLYFLNQTYNMQSDLFDRSVGDALHNVTNKLTKLDRVKFIAVKTQTADSQKRVITGLSNFRIKRTDGRELHLISRKNVKRDSLKSKSERLRKELTAPDQQLRVTIKVSTDEYGTVHQQEYYKIVNVPHADKAIDQKINRYDTVRIAYPDPQFGRQILTSTQENPLWIAQQMRKQKLKQYKAIKRQLEKDSLEELKSQNNKDVFANIADEYEKMNQPLDQRLNQLLIDSLLRSELQSKGINLPFSYMVSTADNDSVIFTKAMDTTGVKPVFNAADMPYQTTIYPNEVLNDPGMLRLAFPKKNNLILSQMGFSMGTSGGLLLILIFCFGYTIFSILRQKKISEMKTDFINNMTHEFKTPVSTIMIASEALKDDELTADKSRITRLANIIYEENARLGSHIERVLNIARIEKDDFKLDINPLDVNEVITDVVDSMSLKLQKYGAETSLRLDALNAMINADELHFSNVLYNLIDNAIKYSNGTPQISITTAINKGNLIITVADKGIGMTRDEQARIFEQFYRIPTGNLHDVKGFGLGLSYVNTIVKRLDGTISVRSEKDKGSEFELKFPLV